MKPSHTVAILPKLSHNGHLDFIKVMKDFNLPDLKVSSTQSNGNTVLIDKDNSTNNVISMLPIIAAERKSHAPTTKNGWE